MRESDYFSGILNQFHKLFGMGSEKKCLFNSLVTFSVWGDVPFS